MNAIQILLSARDQASAQIQKVNAELGALEATSKRSAIGLSAFAGGAAIAASAIAVVGAAVIRSTIELAAQVEELNNLSQASGVARAELYALGAVFEDSANVTLPELARGLRAFNKAISDGDPLLGKLGVTSKDTRTALGQLADAFSHMKDGADKSAIAQQLLGRQSIALIATLNQGGAALNEQVGYMMRYQKAVIDNADTLQQLDDTSDHLRRQWQSLGSQLIANLSPAILSLATNLSKLLDGFSKIAEMVGKNPWLLALFAASPGGALGLAFKLGKAPALGGGNGGGNQNSPNLNPPGEPRGIEYNIADMGPKNSTVDEILIIGRDRGRLRREIVQGWKDLFDDISSLSNNVTTTLNAAFYGLTSGFQQVAVNLLGTGQTLRSALVTIFRSMVTEILAELARLAAARVFKFLLTLAVPGASPAAILGAGFAGGVSAGRPRMEAAPLGAGGERHIHIHGYNMRDVAMDLLSPFGALRRGSDVVTVGRNY